MTVPDTLRSEAIEEADRRCAIFEDGKRCHARHELEAHYIIDPDAGGEITIHNVIIVCPEHVTAITGAARRLAAHHLTGKAA